MWTHSHQVRAISCYTISRGPDNLPTVFWYYDPLTLPALHQSNDQSPFSCWKGHAQWSGSDTGPWLAKTNVWTVCIMIWRCSMNLYSRPAASWWKQNVIIWSRVCRGKHRFEIKCTQEEYPTFVHTCRYPVRSAIVVMLFKVWVKMGDWMKIWSQERRPNLIALPSLPHGTWG